MKPQAHSYKRGVKHTNKLILLLMIFSLGSAAFAQSPADAQDSTKPELTIGGQDGGGAGAIRSTREEALEAIRMAYEIIGRKDANDSYGNIFMRFWISYTGGEAVEGFDPKPLFPKFELSDFPKIDSSSPALEAMLKNPPELIYEGECQGSRPKAVASVSRFDSTGTVCISVRPLMKYHPAVLLSEALGTLLHEALHLSGVKEEKIPELWQEEFGKYFRWRFSTLEEQHIKERTLARLEIAQKYLNFALEINRSKPDDPLVYVVIGALGRLIISLPYLFDPIALDLAVRPKNPDLVNNYSNTLLALFIFGEREFTQKGKYYLSHPKEMRVLLHTFNVNIAKVKRAFLAYADGANEGERNRGSHCVLRDHETSIGTWLESDMNRYRADGLNPSLFIPPKECAPRTVRESIDSVAKAMPTGKPRRHH